MRTRVYRNFTFKAINNNTVVFRSDNFFTVESSVTAILKDRIADKMEPVEYEIVQESKDGKSSRVIEVIYYREGEDVINIDMK